MRRGGAAGLGRHLVPPREAPPRGRLDVMRATPVHTPLRTIDALTQEVCRRAAERPVRPPRDWPAPALRAARTSLRCWLRRRSRRGPAVDGALSTLRLW